MQFKGEEYIRVGSYKKRLKDHPQLEQRLWRAFDTTPFEKQIAEERLAGPDVLQLLDYPSYFELLGLPLPGDRTAILAALAADRMIVANDAGGWDITNLGAVLFAKRLDAFTGLGRKAPRVVVYEGKARLRTLREQVGVLGYASGFTRLIEYINALLPRNEVIGKALRSDVPMYPELAVRELVANALIHQDFSITGAGPMIEVFEDRMEITNPGSALVDVARFVDAPPRSRNEILASFMRRAGICEERGSGVDKVVFETEFYQLPAPLFETPGDSTRAVLFAHRAFKDMTRTDRVWACYLHASLKRVQGEAMTNATLRARFGIEERNSATASRIIGDAIAAGLVRPLEERQGRKFARYVPFWA